MSDSHIAPRLEVAHDRVCGREVHDALASTQVLGLITSLRVRMGDDLMTEVTGASSAAIEEWCDGWLELPPDAEARLRLVDTIFGTFDDHGAPEDTTLVWFGTPNLNLGGRTPAATLRTGEPTDAAPALLVAARASIA
jgi:hypothetical protein